MSTAETPRIVALIPALDEEEPLPHVLRALARTRVDMVVVVDNGSSDRTSEVARAQGALVRREERRGYGAACLRGLAVFEGRTALEPGEEQFAAHLPLRSHDVIVFLDADGSDDVRDLERLVEPILAGEAHFVLGTRNADMESRAALTPQQRFGNALSCFLLRVLFGARHCDLGPFRAIRSDALRHLAMEDLDYGWTVEMQIKARIARLSVLEVPVRYRPRIAGHSKISGTFLGTLGAGRKILIWLVGWRLWLFTPFRRIPTFR